MMHRYFDDHVAINDLGTADRTCHVVNPSRPARGGAAAHRAPKSAESPEPRKPADRVEAQVEQKISTDIKPKVADGKISDQEKASFSTPDAKKAVDVLRSRLSAQLKDKFSETTTSSGRGSSRTTKTEHGKLLDKLKEDAKRDGDLTKIDDDLKTATEQKWSPESIKMLQDLRDARQKDENKVVDAIKQKIELVGTLEGQKIAIDASSEKQKAEADKKAAEAKMRELEKQANASAIKVFKANDGQDYSPDWFGDDWDSVNDSYDFAKVVKQFEGDPAKLDDWASHQDNATSKAAATELARITKDYLAQRDISTKSSETLDGFEQQKHEVNAELDRVKQSIAADREVLSKPTIDKLDAEVPNPIAEKPKPDAGKPGPANPDTPTSGTPPKPDAGKPDPANPDTPTSGTPTQPDAGKPDPANPDTPTSGTPTQPQPTGPTKSADDVVRDHGGMGAQYTVQRGDSLSKIAQQYSDSYGININWNDVYNANKGMVGDPQVVNGITYVMIYPGQVLNVPGVTEKIDEEVTNSIPRSGPR